MAERHTPNYKNRSALMVGLGHSGLETIEFLHSRGAKVKLSDSRLRENLDPELAILEKKGIPVELECGTNTINFCSGVDFAVTSTGLQPDFAFLEEIKRMNIPVCSALDLALRELRMPIIAYIGSYGKTSAIEVTRHILEVAGKKALVSSDLHKPLITSIEKPADVLLLELSEEQLNQLSPLQLHTIIFTCLHQEKPNGYESIEDYYRNQFKILQDADEMVNVIYNYRDLGLRTIVPPFSGRKRLVRRKNPNSISEEFYARYHGAFLENTRKICWKGDSLSSYELIHAPIFGLHQKDNFMFAISVAKLLGVEDGIIQKAIDSFRGIPHRLELIKKWEGVRFVNDSRSINSKSLGLSLRAFPHNSVILIAGGKAQKDVSYLHLAKLIKERVKTMILIGESKEQLSRELGGYTETFLMGTLEEAILLSHQKSREGDVILFSPGSPSYDKLKDYQERGNYFTRYLEDI